ncbi:hypothetical protein SLE2022_345380 [Rubroshorea leprosula]
MGDFIADLQSFHSSLACLGIDPIMEPINQIAGTSQNTPEVPTLNLQSSMPNFYPSGSYFSHQESDFPEFWTQNSQGIIHSGTQNEGPVVQSNDTAKVESIGSKKRKAKDFSESSSGSSSPQVIKRRNGSGKGKRVKGNEEEPKEVVHVRAKRGQATNRHSLAERVRRGKINEKLKLLQDIVPGCYKTMGMAVMLEEIINYVKSLQNQVEFLSKELTAAFRLSNFNSETDGLETMQRVKEQEGKELERLIREGGYGGPSCFNSTWPL